MTTPGPSPTSYTNSRFCTPTWLAAKPTPGASYMVWIIPSTTRRKASSISVTSLQCCFSTGSPKVRIANGATSPRLREVPRSDGSPPVLVAEEGDRRRVEEQAAGFARRQFQICGGQDAEKVAVAEEGDVDVAVFGSEFVEEACRPAGRLRQRLASGAAVPEQVPVRAIGAYLGGRPSFVLAVVQLGEQMRHFGHGPAGEAGGIEGPPSGTGQNVRRSHAQPLQPLAELPALPHALVGQGHVGTARMAPGEGPLGLAVADEDEALHERSTRRAGGRLRRAGAR